MGKNVSESRKFKWFLSGTDGWRLRKILGLGGPSSAPGGPQFSTGRAQFSTGRTPVQRSLFQALRQVGVWWWEIGRIQCEGKEIPLVGILAGGFPGPGDADKRKPWNNSEFGGQSQVVFA